MELEVTRARGLRIARDLISKKLSKQEQVARHKLLDSATADIIARYKAELPQADTAFIRTPEVVNYTSLRTLGKRRSLVRLNARLEAAVKGVKKTTPEQSSTPTINAVLMFQKMEEQQDIARVMKKRALQMYEEALVMAEKCRSRVRLK